MSTSKRLWPTLEQVLRRQGLARAGAKIAEPTDTPFRMSSLACSLRGFAGGNFDMLWDWLPANVKIATSSC